MTSDKRKCIISGTSGFLGSQLKAYFLKRDWEVYELRHDQKSSDLSNRLLIPFSLGKEIDPKIFQNIDVLIHCAYDFRQKSWADIFKVNVNGSLKLFEAAEKGGAGKIVYISSMAAFDGCKSLYGKAKLALEKEALRKGIIVIRPGLIFGENPRGIFGTLDKVVTKFNVIPLTGFGNQRLYVVHIEDLCKFILKICTENIKDTGKPIIAASGEGLTFKNLLEKIAYSKDKTLFFIPVPHQILWLVLKTCEVIGLNVGFRSDSLISLVNYNPNPDFDSLIFKHIQFRGFNNRC